jgi:hypothetical protein
MSKSDSKPGGVTGFLSNPKTIIAGLLLAIACGLFAIWQPHSKLTCSSIVPVRLQTN